MGGVGGESYTTGKWWRKCPSFPEVEKPLLRCESEYNCGPHLQVATTQTFVLTAKNYFYMVKIKRKMYFHLRKRCPSHEKSLFAAVFSLTSLKVKGARKWSDRVGASAESESDHIAHPYFCYYFTFRSCVKLSYEKIEGLLVNKKKKQRKTYFGGAVFI